MDPSNNSESTTPQQSEPGPSGYEKSPTASNSNIQEERDVEIGDYVWAKMIGHPKWPAKIVGEVEIDAQGRKVFQVKFFGTGDYATLSEIHIQHYSNEEEILSQLYPEKKKEEQEKEKLVKKKKGKKASSAKQKGKKELSAAKKEKLKAAIREIEKAMAYGEDAFSDIEEATSDVEEEAISDIEEEAISDIEEAISSIGEESDSVIEKPEVQAESKKRKHEESSELSKRRKIDITQKPIVPEPNAGTWYNLLKIETLKSKAVLGVFGSGSQYFEILEKSVNFFSECFHGSTEWDVSKVIVWTGMLQKVKEKGINPKFLQWENDPLKIVEDSDVIISCFPDVEILKSSKNWDDIRNRIVSGKTYVELTPVDADTTITNSREIFELGGIYIEAPVLGSEPFIKGEKMALMVAGRNSSALMADIYQYLSIFAYPVLLSDKNDGQAFATKISLIYHMMIGTILASLHEALTSASKSALDPRHLMKIIDIINCPFITNKGYEMIETVSVDANLEVIEKRMKSAIYMAICCVQPLPISTTAHSALVNLIQSKYEDESKMRKPKRSKFKRHRKKNISS